MRYNSGMHLPVFPQFTDIDFSYKETINGFLSRYPLEASEYTFTNLFAFRLAYEFKISEFKNNLVIMRKRKPCSFFCPVGNSGIPGVLGELFEYLRDKSVDPCIERAPEGFVKAHLKNNQDFIIEESRDQFDYIYSVKDLIELKGNRFHDKKNMINRFRSSYRYQYVPLEPGMVEECIAFEDYWCEKRECGKYPGLEKERCAILEMLNNFEHFDIKGGIIRIENKIAALTLGEMISRDTFVIHVEKANPDIQGLYQVINQEFLMHEAREFSFVNREQDLGDAGLRRAKMSYNPVRFVKKYKIRGKAE